MQCTLLRLVLDWMCLSDVCLRHFEVYGHCFGGHWDWILCREGRTLCGWVWVYVYGCACARTTVHVNPVKYLSCGSRDTSFISNNLYYVIAQALSNTCSALCYDTPRGRKVTARSCSTSIQGMICERNLLSILLAITTC